MTVNKFKDLIDHRFVVKCDNISERNLTLELLIALGYEINGPSMNYLEPGNQDFDYPHPVMERGSNRICCTMYVTDEKKSVRFAEIADLISYLDSSIDERDDEEFLSEFVALMSKEGL